MQPVRIESADGIATVRLADPAHRNALGLAMFDALDEAVARVAADSAVRVVHLGGEGPAFCAGFDLAAAVNDPSLMGTFIGRLSRVNRALRRMPAPVVAVVQGAAIAGGCALLSACDFVIVAPDARLGYPVHRIGVSPAVTLPTLALAVGPGAARAMVTEGALIDGREAERLGLATHVAASAEALVDEAAALVARLAVKPPRALRATKAWLNALDGSDLDARFEQTMEASAALADGDEARELLRAFWAARS